LNEYKLGYAYRLGYEQLRGLALNFASTHQVGNSAGISKVDETKQLILYSVSSRFILRL